MCIRDRPSDDYIVNLNSPIKNIFSGIGGIDTTMDTTDNALFSGSATILNSINLRRNGPYQHPSWKQIRTGETNVLARWHKKNNVISISLDNPGGGLESPGDEDFGVE